MEQQRLIGITMGLGEPPADRDRRCRPTCPVTASASGIRAETPEDAERRELVEGWLNLHGRLVDDPATPVARQSSRPFHGDAVRELVPALANSRERHPGQVHTTPLDVAFDGAVCQPDVFRLPHARHTDR